ncbi:hypothetical protein [Haladaptatus sp. NG-SE-30]
MRAALVIIDSQELAPGQEWGRVRYHSQPMVGRSASSTGRWGTAR